MTEPSNLRDAAAAWLYTDEEGGRVACVEQIEPPFEGWTETALYTHPPAAPTDALVEKVARALADSDGARWDAADYTQTPSGECPEDMREGYRQNARAALAAMQ